MFTRPCSSPISARFTLPVGYTTFDPVQQQRALQNLVDASAHDKNNLPPMSSEGFLKTARRLAMPFNETVDIRPENLQETTKIFHPFGVEGSGTFVPDPNSPATGLFQGAHLFIRLSLAGTTGFAPGLAIKWFVKGQPSQNTFALFSLDGQDDNHNFMANALSNRIPVPKNPFLFLGGLILSLIKKDPYEIPIKNLATVTKAGETIANPISPEQIIFQPTENAQNLFVGTENSENDFRADLINRLRPSLPLYNVVGVFPGEEQPVLLGVVWTGIDGLKASEFGERALFFHHDR